MVWWAIHLAACDVRRYADATPTGPRGAVDADADADADADVDADVDTDVTGDTGAPCPEEVLASVPGAVSGDTTGRSDDHTGSCGGDAASDVVVAYTASVGGDYVFDTFGSSYDTVLYALDGCSGVEIACNDDAAVGVRSELGVPLAAGETVYLVVDGGSGPFTLNGTLVPPCADFALPSTTPAAGDGDTTGATDDAAGTCGGENGPDHLWSFTAPSAGAWTFDTVGSTYDTVLYVLDGCGGPELECNDDADGLQSEVVVTLAAGQTIIVAVDGYWATSDGPYTLNVR